MTYTRAQILENRQKWIDYLKRPETKKHKGSLANWNDSEARCCLGHACHVFIPETKKYDQRLCTVYYGKEDEKDMGVAPDSVAKMLGLWSRNGSPSSLYSEERAIILGKSCLSEANDCTELSPQEIGEYLESVINGGYDTPFLPLSDYPE